jgi:hypothetical protein
MSDDPKPQTPDQQDNTPPQKKKGFFARLFGNFSSKKKRETQSLAVPANQKEYPTERVSSPVAAQPQAPSSTPDKDKAQEAKEEANKEKAPEAAGKKLVSNKSAEKEGAPKKSNVAQVFEEKMAEKLEMEQKMSKKSYKEDFKSDVKVADLALKLKASGKPMPIMGLTMNIKKLNQLSQSRGLEEENLNDASKSPEDAPGDEEDAPVRFIDLGVSKELLDAPIKPAEPLRDTILDRPVIGQKSRRPPKN